MNQTEMLRYALTLEKAHLALLNNKDMIDFWGSEAEVAMGNDVFDMCQEAGLFLECDLKATADEIAISNISQIEELLVDLEEN